MAYQALLAKWNKVYNLTALRDPAQMVTHHLLDSLSAVSAFTGAQRVLDVGAGGGLPGIVLAIWAAQAQPQMKITLVDTVQKKTAFLNQVKAQLQLGNVTVVHQESADTYKVVATVPTFAGAKTITVDPKTHNVYLFQPERGPAPAPPPDAPPPATPRGRGRGPQGPIVASWFIVITQS